MACMDYGLYGLCIELWTWLGQGRGQQAAEEGEREENLDGLLEIFPFPFFI